MRCILSVAAADTQCGMRLYEYFTSCKESSCLETYAVSTSCVVAFVAFCLAFCQSSVKPYVSPPAAKCRKFCLLVVAMFVSSVDAP